MQKEILVSVDRYSKKEVKASKAFREWVREQKATTPEIQSLDGFVLPNGTIIYRSKVNNEIKFGVLNTMIEHIEGGLITTHIFRCGMVSDSFYTALLISLLMSNGAHANMQNLFSLGFLLMTDEGIQMDTREISFRKMESEVKKVFDFNGFFKGFYLNPDSVFSIELANERLMFLLLNKPVNKVTGESNDTKISIAKRLLNAISPEK